MEGNTINNPNKGLNKIIKQERNTTTENKMTITNQSNIDLKKDIQKVKTIISDHEFKKGKELKTILQQCFVQTNFKSHHQKLVQEEKNQKDCKENQKLDQEDKQQLEFMFRKQLYTTIPVQTSVDDKIQQVICQKQTILDEQINKIKILLNQILIYGNETKKQYCLGLKKIVESQLHKSYVKRFDSFDQKIINYYEESDDSGYSNQHIILRNNSINRDNFYYRSQCIFKDICNYLQLEIQILRKAKKLIK